jgi:hypothetical protein
MERVVWLLLVRNTRADPAVRSIPTQPNRHLPTGARANSLPRHSASPMDMGAGTRSRLRPHRHTVHKLPRCARDPARAQSAQRVAIELDTAFGVLR